MLSACYQSGGQGTKVRRGEGGGAVGWDVGGGGGALEIIVKAGACARRGFQCDGC